MHRLRSLALPFALVILAGCACVRSQQLSSATSDVHDQHAAADGDGVGGDGPGPSPDGSGGDGDAQLAARRAFQNPGGKWMPQQLAAQAELLGSLGLRISAAELADPAGAPLGAIANVGGCTGSFVSADGLIITNHHCVQAALQVNSTPEHNLVEDGFLASSRADERTVGAAGRVTVARSFKNITADMLDGLAAIADDRARDAELERREKVQLAACEGGRNGVKCSVDGFFRGGEYWLIEYQELRDVRLVHAPARSVGSYGGDIDNWMWPRHSGDYAFLRAYTGKSGASADFAADNEPFHPAHFLKVSTAGVRANDLVMVAGYPAITRRLLTSAEVKAMIDWELPRDLARRAEVAAVLAEVAKQGEAVAIKASPLIQGNANYLKKNQGVLDGLTRGGLAERKAAEDASLRAYIAADDSRGAAGKSLALLDALAAEKVRTRDADAALTETMPPGSLLSAAMTLVRVAEERPKADADREPAFQEREWPRMRARQKQFLAEYDRAIDRAGLRLALTRAAADWSHDADFVTALFSAVVDKKLRAAPTAKEIDALLDRAYDKTKLEPEGARLRLFEKATTRALKKRKDPFIRMALALRPYQLAMEERGKVNRGKLALAMPAYIEALRASSGGQLAPDANRTLRVTYGTIRGYRREPGADELAPFTKLSEVAAKATGVAPFNAPTKLVELIKSGAGNESAYRDAALGEVPVDFLSDLDITGGNSGSPTLNSSGELVGLAFDGNLEAVASDYLFQPEITRTIHVDIRYVLWAMDGVYGADALLQEMGVTPSM